MDCLSQQLLWLLESRERSSEVPRPDRRIAGDAGGRSRLLLIFASFMQGVRQPSKAHDRSFLHRPQLEVGRIGVLNA